MTTSNYTSKIRVKYSEKIIQLEVVIKNILPNKWPYFTRNINNEFFQLAKLLIFVFDLHVYVINGWTEWRIGKAKKEQEAITLQKIRDLLKPGQGRTGIAFQMPDQNVIFWFGRGVFRGKK